MSLKLEPNPLDAVLHTLRFRTRELKTSLSCVGHIQRKKALTETDKSSIFDRDFICLDLSMKDGSLKQAMKDGTVQAHQHPYKHYTAVVDFATLEPSELQLRRMRLSMTCSGETAAKVGSVLTQEPVWSFYVPLPHKYPAQADAASWADLEFHHTYFGKLWSLITKQAAIQAGKRWMGPSLGIPAFEDLFAAVLMGALTSENSNCKIVTFKLPASDASAGMAHMDTVAELWWPKDVKSLLPHMEWSIQNCSLVLMPLPGLTTLPDYQDQKKGNISLKKRHSVAQHFPHGFVIGRTCCAQRWQNFVQV